MAEFGPAYAWLMQSEDPSYLYADVPDVQSHPITMKCSVCQADPRVPCAGIPTDTFHPERKAAALSWAISGINSHSFPADYAFIRSIRQEDRGPAVANFYQKKFWEPMKLSALIAQSVANRVFDMGVNGGAMTAIIILQDAINALSVAGIDADGHLGPLTLAAANRLPEGELLDAYRAQRLGHYQEIVDRNSTMAKYLGTRENPGPWWRRAAA